MEVVLGIDLGTSYFKMGLFDRQGRLQGMSRIAVPRQKFSEQRCELQTTMFQDLLARGLKYACNEVGIQANDIQAVSYASQANSFILLDERYQPLTPLVLWPDRRVAQPDRDIAALFRSADFQERTGLGFHGPELCLEKLRWYQRFEPQIWSRVGHIMTISDYLVFLLTGQPVGDEETAAMLGCWDLLGKTWWEPALQVAHLHRENLSQPLPSGTLVGPSSKEARELFGLPPGTPVVAGGLDHYLASVGAGVPHLAEWNVSLGTVLACLGHMEHYQFTPQGCTGPGHGGDFYQLLFDNHGAEVLEWYRSTFVPVKNLEELISEAASIDIGCEGLLALPSVCHYANRKGFLNANACFSDGYYVRALLESVAGRLLLLIETLPETRKPSTIVATGGGAKSPVWLQIMADMLYTELLVTDCFEPACRGAAMFAARAAGWCDRISELQRMWLRIERHYIPVHHRHEQYLCWFAKFRETVRQHENV